MPVDPNKINPEQLYTVKEAASFLEVTEQTVRKHIREKKLEAHKSGKKFLIKGRQLLLLVEPS